MDKQEIPSELSQFGNGDSYGTIEELREGIQEISSLIEIDSEEFVEGSKIYRFLVTGKDYRFLVQVLYAGKQYHIEWGRCEGI